MKPLLCSNWSFSRKTICLVSYLLSPFLLEACYSQKKPVSRFKLCSRRPRGASWNREKERWWAEGSLHSKEKKRNWLLYGLFIKYVFRISHLFTYYYAFHIFFQVITWTQAGEKHMYSLILSVFIMETVAKGMINIYCWTSDQIYVHLHWR